MAGKKKPVAAELGTVSGTATEGIEDYKYVREPWLLGGACHIGSALFLRLRAEARWRHSTSPTSGGGVCVREKTQGQKHKILLRATGRAERGVTS